MTVTKLSMEYQLRYTTQKLGEFLAQERRRFQQSVIARTDYSKNSHRILKALVPVYRALNVWHQTEGTSQNFASAPTQLAKALVEHFIAPFEPTVWRTAVDPLDGRAPAFRAHVQFYHSAKGQSSDIYNLHIPPGFLKHAFPKEDKDLSSWLAGQVMYDEHCVWAIRNLEGTSILELREAYEQYRRDIAKNRKARVSEILVKVQSVLSEEEQALLQSTLLVV